MGVLKLWHKRPVVMPSEPEKMSTEDTTSQENSPAHISREEQTGKKDDEQSFPKPDTTPNRWSLLALFLALFFALTCIGLDRSIVAVAIPQITTDFNSLPDVGWYGSAFLLTTCCFQLLFGKLYAEFNIKWIFLSSLLIFEVGSVVCAAAPSSGALIAGRAVKGVGAAGVLAGAFIIVAHTVPMDRRPKYTGALGGGVSIAQMIAPTLGGVLTDRLNWRWCFWINLPFGGVTALILLFAPLPKPPKTRPTPRQFLRKFDLVGTLLLIPWTTTLLLALQWGGTTYAWSSWRIILLLALFAVLFVAWCASQILQGDKATLPPRILKQRTMVAAFFYMFLNFATFFLITYYVPIWMQAVRGESPYWAGIHLLAMSGATAVSVLAAGYLTTWIGYFVPQMIAGTILLSAGCGMLYTFNLETSNAFWIGTLILIGIGTGLGIQQPVIAVQTVFAGPSAALAISALIFSQSLSSTIFLCVGQNIFSNNLITNLRTMAPEIGDPQVVVDAGAADVHRVVGDQVGEQSLRNVLLAYNGALRRVFLVCVVACCLTLLGALGVEWVSVKKEKKVVEQGPESKTEDKEKAEPAFEEQAKEQAK